MSISISSPESGRPTQFWKRVGWLTIGQAMEKGGQLAFVLILVRILAPERWNVAALSLSLYLAAITIGSFNLEQSVLFYLPRLDEVRQNALVIRTSLLLGSVGLLVATGVAIVSRVTGIFGSGVAPYFLALAIAVEMPSVIAGPVLILRGRTTASGVWDTVQAVLQCAAVIIPAALGYSNSVMMAGLLLASVVRLVSYLLVLPEVFRTSMKYAERSLLVEQLIFCAPLGLALATGTLARVVDKWIVAWQLPHLIGMYAVAAQEIPLLSVLPYAGGAAIAVALVESLGRNEVMAAHELWYRQAAAMCRSVVPLVVGLAISAPELFTVLFGTRYASAIVPFQVFTLVGIHRVTEYGVVLRAAGRNTEVVLSSFVLLGCNLTLGVPAVIVGGVLGLTIASVCAFAIAWWWILGRVGNVFGKSRIQVFPWATWLTRVCIYGLTGVVVSFFTVNIESSGLRLISKCLFLGVVVLIAERSLGDNKPVDAVVEIFSASEMETRA